MDVRIRDAVLGCAGGRDSFYLYDEAGIRERAKFLKRTFPGVQFLYSVKCNPHPQVLRCLASEGFGADAASSAEVLRSRLAGFSPENIYYSAPGKSADDVADTLGRSVLIADSLNEIGRIRAEAGSRGETAEIGVRVNPDFSFAGGPGTPSKFGIDEEELFSHAEEIASGRIRITGLHVHLKSQELDAGTLARYHERMFRLAGRFAEVFGAPAYVNMGSGIGVPYEAGEEPLDFGALGQAFAENLRRFRTRFPDTKVIVETGRFPVCQNGYFVTRVMDKKTSRGKTYLILKNTLNGFIRAPMAKLVTGCAAGTPSGLEPLFTSGKAFETAALSDGGETETVTLAGNLCTAADTVAEDVTMPKLEPGDLVLMTNAGSYAATLSPVGFSSHEPPAELFLLASGEVTE